MSADCFSFWGLCPQPLPGLRLWTSLGDFRSPDPWAVAPAASPNENSLRRCHFIVSLVIASRVSRIQSADGHFKPLILAVDRIWLGL